MAKTYKVKEAVAPEATTIFTITEPQAPVVREVTVEQLEQQKAQIQEQIDNLAEQMAILDADKVELVKIAPVAEVVSK